MSRQRILTTAPGTRPEAFGPCEWGLLVAVASMWGSSFLWIAEGLEHLTPPVITLCRLVLGAAVLVIFPAARAKVQQTDWPRVVLLGLVWMVVPLLLFPIAQQWVDSYIAGAINGSMPLFSAALAVALLRRVPGRRQMLGLTIGFGGVLLVSLSGATGSGGSPLGIGLLVLATFLLALAFNLVIPLAQRYGPLPVLLRTQLVAIGVILPFGLWGLPSSQWDWQGTGSMVLLGVLSSGVAFVASTTLGTRAGPIRGALPNYFLPLVALALGIWVRHEPLRPSALGGVALVIAGAWLGSRREG